jgi:hypothetical protein
LLIWCNIDSCLFWLTLAHGCLLFLGRFIRTYGTRIIIGMAVGGQDSSVLDKNLPRLFPLLRWEGIWKILEIICFQTEKVLPFYWGIYTRDGRQVFVLLLLHTKLLFPDVIYINCWMSWLDIGSRGFQSRYAAQGRKSNKMYYEFPE